uniref:HD/PDEase domain-containing protein n=1 Tax=viral metagenome TaxID=1070528 RepID=A0A6C0DBM3_9ZZZZ
MTSNQDCNTIYGKLIKVRIPQQVRVTPTKTDGLTTTITSNFTWANIFEHIKSQHWHSCGKATCPHNESLFDHLISCAEICYQTAKTHGYNEKETTKAYLGGLLHDIGKPGTLVIQGKHTSFKGHALVGGALIEDFYSVELLDVFGLTKSDWGDISTLADFHMCTYFPNQTSLLHKFTGNILPDSIKRLLIILRRGDQLSMVPSSTYSKTAEQIRENIDHTEEEYVQSLFSSQDYKLLDKKKGLLILNNGGSSTGKSTFCANLKRKFGSKSIWVPRDLYTVRIVSGNHDITLDQISPEFYQETMEKYKASGKKEASDINKAMMNDIYDGLQMGLIVIVDTCATMFDAIDTIIPEIAQDAFRVAFWHHRNTVITEEESLGRWGMSLNNQLDAHGETSLYNPFMSKINWRKMIATTEGEDDSLYQAHLAISIGWSGIKDDILKHLYKKFEEIYDYNQSIPRVPILSQTMNMDLRELVEKLRNAGSIREFFSYYKYTVSDHIKGCVGIKYMDGVNKIWQPKWARQARGRFYFTESESVIPLKDSLDRGVELITKVHTDNGIDGTQDIEKSNCHHLETYQKQLIKTLSGNNKLDTNLTGKADGSLLGVTIYPVNSVQYSIISELGLNYSDEFTKTIVQYCLDNSLPIVIVSTSGTLFISDKMKDYFLTSIQNLINKKVTSFADWATIVPDFVNLFIDYYRSLSFADNKMVSFYFEAICKERTTFLGNVHRELAKSYDDHYFILLGAMWNNRYVPHFDLPRRIFKQPMHLKITNTSQIFELMKQLDQVVNGNLSKDKFLENFTLDEFTTRTIHAEGFVMLTPKDDTYDYEKIKTLMYYNCHKVKIDKIGELLKLPASCAEHYPILEELHNFFDNFDQKIQPFVETCHQALLKEINFESEFFLCQNAKAQDRMKGIIESADNNSLTIVCKMLINTKGIGKIFAPITDMYYGSSSDEILSFTRNLLMNSRPWEPEFESRLNITQTFKNSLFEIASGCKLD